MIQNLLLRWKNHAKVCGVRIECEKFVTFSEHESLKNAPFYYFMWAKMI